MKDLINKLKQRLMTGWTFLRIVRLALALIITFEAWNSSEMLFAVLGGFLAFQAIFNYGCCDTGGCEIDHTSSKPKSSSEAEGATTFNEVK
jgi:hypothetical protein